MDGFELMIGAMFLVIGIGLGNALGDQATLRDCAIRGEAKMAGSGTIECTVKKESK